MAQNYVSGYASYVNYGYETTYGTVTTFPRVFGVGQKITHTRRNNMERLFGLGARNASANVAKKYEGTASIEFVLSNCGFFRGVLGAVSYGAPSNTYVEANTIPSFSVASATELGSLDEVTSLIGCKVGSMTLTAAQGEVARVRLECPYKTETVTTGSIGSAVAETYAPFSFAQGLVEWTAAGGTVGTVQSFELTINNDLEGLWGLGSRYKNIDVEKRREYNIRMSIAFRNTAEFMTKFFGKAMDIAATDLATLNPAAQATIVLTFTQGTGAGTAGNEKIVITLANVYFDEDSLPKDVNEIIKEDVTGWALSGTSVVWSNTATDTGTP